MNFSEAFHSGNYGSEALFNSAFEQQRRSQVHQWQMLLKGQKLPREGWSDAAIEAFLLQVSAADANNFKGAAGMGEREGRVHSSIVRRRHFGFAHGMGRSGNLMDSQPKAVGSSVIVQLTTKLLVHALRIWGFSRHCFAQPSSFLITPICTGMTLTQAMLAVESPFKQVIWLRIDQKSCFKSILAANLEIIVVEGRKNKRDEFRDELETDLQALEEAIISRKGQIHSIVSCVSCFAPRVPDSIVQISQLAAKYSIAHIVNGAYAACSPRARNLINEAFRPGDLSSRVDAVVMSLDKNFLVPVGGAFVFGPIAERIAERWPGRAGSSHIIDLLITLLGMGQCHLERLWQNRLDNFNFLQDQLLRFEAKSSLRVRLLQTPSNDISLALQIIDTTSVLGSQLFYRNVSGARLISPHSCITLSLPSTDLVSFGTHHSSAVSDGTVYLNVAAAIGSTREEIETFCEKLLKLLKKSTFDDENRAKTEGCSE